MSMFSVLRRFFVRTETAPPQISPSFAPGGLDTPDDIEVTQGFDLEHESAAAPKRSQAVGIYRHGQRIDDDLWGITFAIEYVDARGIKTVRRITLHDRYQGSDGTMYLRCFCHERQAARTFRFDRIQSVIDLDGEVHDPTTYFRNELRVEIPEAAIQQAEMQYSRGREKPFPSMCDKTLSKPGIIQRRSARDGVRLLAALARSDGVMHESEVSVVVKYIEDRSALDGIDTNDDDRMALTGYVKRQYPAANVLEECLARLEECPTQQQQLFLNSAIALVHADGYEHPDELAVLHRLQQQISGAATKVV